MFSFICRTITMDIDEDTEFKFDNHSFYVNLLPVQYIYIYI